MKSYSPKGRVANIAGLFYPDETVSVTGSRSGAMYETAVLINNRIVATGNHRNWRVAYKVLEIELSKRFIA